MNQQRHSTSAVVDTLASRNITASRDRVARMADRLFGRPARDVGRHRRYSDDEVDLLVAAFRLQDECGLPVEEVERLAGVDPSMVAVTIEQRIAALRSTADQFTALREHMESTREEATTTP